MEAHGCDEAQAAIALDAQDQLRGLTELHQKQLDTDGHQAMASVLRTTAGAELFKRGWPRPKSKPVRVDPSKIYAVRLALQAQLRPRLDRAFDKDGQTTGVDPEFAGVSAQPFPASPKGVSSTKR